MRPLIAKYGAIFAVVVLLIAGVYAYCASKTTTAAARGTPMAFYVDENSGEESILPLADDPPLPNKDGNPTLVRAIKVTPDGGKTVTTAYYEKYSDDAKAQLNTFEKDDPRRTGVAITGLLVRLPQQGSPWVPENSPDGSKVVQQGTGENTTLVSPPAK